MLAPRVLALFHAQRVSAWQAGDAEYQLSIFSPTVLVFPSNSHKCSLTSFEDAENNQSNRVSVGFHWALHALTHMHFNAWSQLTCAVVQRLLHYRICKGCNLIQQINIYQANRDTVWQPGGKFQVGMLELPSQVFDGFILLNFITPCYHCNHIIQHM